jgi:hypothetical protein
VVLFVGDDWAEAHHDVELMDASGRKLLSALLHALVAGQFGGVGLRYW